MPVETLIEVRDIGWVSEVGGNRMSCLIRLRHGPSTPVPAPLDELTFGPVKEVLEPNGEDRPSASQALECSTPIVASSGLTQYKK